MASFFALIQAVIFFSCSLFPWTINGINANTFVSLSSPSAASYSFSGSLFAYTSDLSTDIAHLLSVLRQPATTSILILEELAFYLPGQRNVFMPLSRA